MSIQKVNFINPYEIFKNKYGTFNLKHFVKFHNIRLIYRMRTTFEYKELNMQNIMKKLLAVIKVT